MKKLYFLLILSLSLCSCSNDESLFDEEPSVSSLRSASGKYRMLGFGYDVMGENLSKESLRWPVLDVEKLASVAYTVIDDSQTGGDNFFYYGYSSLDYVKDVTKKTGFSATASGVDFEKIKLCSFSGNISSNNEFQTKYTYSTKYSFASADIVKYIRTYSIAKNRNELSNFVTAKFLEDLKNFTPDDFVNRYGTHVLTDITLGGHLKVIYRSAIVDESSYTRKKEVIKAGLNGVLKSIGLGANIDKETQIEETLTTKNTEKTLYIKYKAGDGVDMSFDLEKGSASIINKYTWEKSVTEQNAGLVKINWEYTYPIYDFISDPTKKAQIKAAVERHVERKQLKVMEIVPLYRYYNQKYQNHYYATDISNHSTLVNMGYGLDHVECYVFDKQIEGTKRLYRYYNQKYQNHYYATDISDESALIKMGYSLDNDFKCYVYDKQIEGTIRLYRYYNRKYQNHYYATDISDESALIKMGYSLDNDFKCYVYPGVK